MEKTLNVAKDKLGNYYDENTYLEMLKDGGKVLQSIIEDSVNSTVKLGYNLTTSPKNLAEIYNISVEEATAIQAVLVVAAANEFGIKKTKAADNVLDLGVDKKDTTIYNGHMLGENGIQIDSKTLKNFTDGGRLDIENPYPGKRAGQIHYQKGNEKYIYDATNNQLVDFKTKDVAPKRIQDLLKKDDFKKAIEKGMKYLGEK